MTLKFGIIIEVIFCQKGIKYQLNLKKVQSIYQPLLAYCKILLIQLYGVKRSFDFYQRKGKILTKIIEYDVSRIRTCIFCLWLFDSGRFENTVSYGREKFHFETFYTVLDSLHTRYNCPKVPFMMKFSILLNLSINWKLYQVIILSKKNI